MFLVGQKTPLTQKRVASMDKIMNDLMRHKKLNQQSRNNSPNTPKGIGQRKNQLSFRARGGARQPIGRITAPSMASRMLQSPGQIRQKIDPTKMGGSPSSVGSPNLLRKSDLISDSKTTDSATVDHMKKLAIADSKEKDMKKTAESKPIMAVTSNSATNSPSSDSSRPPIPKLKIKFTP